MPDFIKQPDGSEVADLGGNVTHLRIVMEFEQRKGRGLFGKAEAKFNPADPDLVAGVGAGRKLVDLIDAKDKPTGFGGAIVHRGDAKGNGKETMDIDLTLLHAEDSDIDAFVLGAFCDGEKGFGRVAGIVWRIYDASPAGRGHLGNVRIDISSTDSSVAAAVLRQRDNRWECRINPTFGRHTSVAGLGDLFRPALGG